MIDKASKRARLLSITQKQIEKLKAVLTNGLKKQLHSLSDDEASDLISAYISALWQSHRRVGKKEEQLIFALIKSPKIKDSAFVGLRKALLKASYLRFKRITKLCAVAQEAQRKTLKETPVKKISCHDRQELSEKTLPIGQKPFMHDPREKTVKLKKASKQ